MDFFYRLFEIITFFKGKKFSNKKKKIIYYFISFIILHFKDNYKNALSGIFLYQL